MTKILKTIFRRLFKSDEKSNKLIDTLKANPNFRTKEEIEKYGTHSQPTFGFKLKSGEFRTIKSPDLGNQKNLVLTKWNCQTGDDVKHGDILCEIENENIVMEFESFFEGRIIWCCEVNTELSIGMEICKIEGI